MSTLRRLFTDHPATVNETYGQHFVSAMSFGLRMIWGGLVCIAHAFVPGVCCSKGSEIIGELHDRMIVNRRRPDPADLTMENRRAA